MVYLVFGLIVWSVVHFFPSISKSGKASFIDRFGRLIYMAVFSLLIVLSLILIVTGWRSSIPTHLYVLPEFFRLFSALLLVLAFVLFVASKLPTRIKQVIRHPQLMSVAIWAFAHLLVNGDSRSVLLFGWLGIWAVVEMILINKREGEWLKPEQANLAQDARCIILGVIVFAGLIYLHPYLSGISLS